MIVAKNNYGDAPAILNQRRIWVEEIKNQWHAGFCSAIELELQDGCMEERLMYYREYLLNSKPVQIDLLVVKKSPDITVNNTLGEFLKGHNLFEFKSPGDSLGIDDYLKGIGYACLYKAQESHEGEIDINDITITFIRDGKPVKLLKYLAGEGYNIIEEYSGIYRFKIPGQFAIQIINTKVIDAEKYVWLKALSNEIEEDTAVKVLELTEQTKNKHQREMMESVVEVSIKANTAVYKRVQEDSMQAIIDLFREDYDRGIEENTKKVTAEVTEQVTSLSIKNLVYTCKELTGSFADAVEQLMKRYGLERSIAEEKVQMYW